MKVYVEATKEWCNYKKAMFLKEFSDKVIVTYLDDEGVLHEDAWYKNNLIRITKKVEDK